MHGQRSSGTYVQWNITQQRNKFESVIMMWMNLETVTQSDVSQKEENKYSKLKHIYEI